DLLRIVDHQHHFVVAGAAGADFLVGWMRCRTACVADRGDVDAVPQFPELAFGAPEAAEPEDRLSEALRIRTLECAVIDEMAIGGADRVSAAGQCLTRLGHCNLIEAEHALVLLNRCPQYRTLRGIAERPGRSRLDQANKRTLHRAGSG